MVVIKKTCQKSSLTVLTFLRYIRVSTGGLKSAEKAKLADVVEAKPPMFTVVDSKVEHVFCLTTLTVVLRFLKLTVLYVKIAFLKILRRRKNDFLLIGVRSSSFYSGSS